MQHIITYRVSILPHPQANYLHSRIALSYSAIVSKYSNNTISILVKERKLRATGGWSNNLEKLKEYMNEFLTTRRVAFEIIDEVRVD